MQNDNIDPPKGWHRKFQSKRQKLVFKGPAGHPGDGKSMRSIATAFWIEIIDWTGIRAGITTGRISGWPLTGTRPIRYADRAESFDSEARGHGFHLQLPGNG
jgi:hypothetical protein